MTVKFLKLLKLLPSVLYILNILHYHLSYFDYPRRWPSMNSQKWVLEIDYFIFAAHKIETSKYKNIDLNNLPKLNSVQVKKIKLSTVYYDIFWTCFLCLIVKDIFCAYNFYRSNKNLHLFISMRFYFYFISILFLSILDLVYRGSHPQLKVPINCPICTRRIILRPIHRCKWLVLLPKSNLGRVCD